MSDERLVVAPPGRIFELLATAACHLDLDGSGMVRRVRDGQSQRLTLGSRFEVEMSQSGIPYAVVNDVVEYEDGRLIAWEVRPSGRFVRTRDRLVGGHRWRYELVPGDGGTRVIETFDYTHARSAVAIRILLFPRRNARAIKAGLERIEALANHACYTTDTPV
ncbi:MAG TPA: SRPBCC family protein [Acidimicrobiia bacterium]|nr:SRPBCC family protein [Acidimicrobiia bacterium]